VLGHRTVHAHLQSFVGARPDVRSWFATVRHPGRIGFWAVKPYPALGSLDLFELRWRLRWSAAARRIVQQRLEATDAVFLNTQACALLLHGDCREVPCVLSVDATGAQYARLEYYRPRDRFSSVGESAVLALERRAYEAATRVLAWTDWVADSLRGDYGIPDDKIVTFHPGAPLQDLRAIPPHAGAPVEPLRALFIGDDVTRKGLPTLLEAVRRLDGEVELDVVTSKQVPESAHTRVHHEVRTGTPEFVDLLAQADVLVLPTRADAAPWVIIEAMAAGLAVVSTAVGAIPELLGEAGVIVPAGDPERLALQLAGLAGDPESCRARGLRARERAAQCYDARVQLPMLLDVMKEAAASRGARAVGRPPSRRRARA
jgi:glycosyltransferase involved in cell wall biosynthesis